MHVKEHILTAENRSSGVMSRSIDSGNMTKALNANVLSLSPSSRDDNQPRDPFSREASSTPIRCLAAGPKLSFTITTIAINPPKLKTPFETKTA